MILQYFEGRMSLGKLKTYQTQSDRKRYVYIGLQEEYKKRKKADRQGEILAGIFVLHFVLHRVA